METTPPPKPTPTPPQVDRGVSLPTPGIVVKAGFWPRPGDWQAAAAAAVAPCCSRGTAASKDDVLPLRGGGGK